jgi:SAM-dependent methyltransferase
VQPSEYEAMHAQELRHWWFRGRRRVLVNLLRQALRSRADLPRILDYGCGTGGNTPVYASLGRVVGIEPDAAAIRLAHTRGQAQYCRSNGTDLPFRPAVFDAVLASDVLEHIEDDHDAMSEIARVLRPGGVVIVTVPAHQWLFSRHDAALHHCRRYSKARLRRLVQGGGLRVRRLSYWNAILFPGICLHRLVEKSRPARGPQSDTRASAPWLINEALAGLLAAEAGILRHAPLPWGLSLIAVGERI